MKTKTIWILLTLISALGLNTNAQSFKYGLLAGLDVSNTRLTNKPEDFVDKPFSHSMLSFNLNGYIGYKSSEFWGLSVEPGFIQKGDKNFNSRYQLNYIQAPLLVDIYLSDKLFLSIGPEFSYMLNAKLKSKNVSYDVSNFYDKQFEISGIIGINYAIIEKIDIGLRYSHGLIYTSELLLTDFEGNPLGNMKEYNQYVQLVMRFKIQSGSNKALK